MSVIFSEKINFATISFGITYILCRIAHRHVYANCVSQISRAQIPINNKQDYKMLSMSAMETFEVVFPVILNIATLRLIKTKTRFRRKSNFTGPRSLQRENSINKYNIKMLVKWLVTICIYIFFFTTNPLQIFSIYCRLNYRAVYCVVSFVLSHVHNDINLLMIMNYSSFKFIIALILILWFCVWNERFIGVTLMCVIGF